MILLDLLFVFIVALLLSLLFVPFTGVARPRDGGSAVGAILFFVLILFFATWAGGVWITPFGPPIWGVYWLPFVIVGLFVALLLAAVAGPTSGGYVRPASEPERAEAEASAARTAFGLLFWLLLASLAVVVIAGYA